MFTKRGIQRVRRHVQSPVVTAGRAARYGRYGGDAGASPRYGVESPMSPSGAHVFLVSPRYRAELTAAVEATGRSVDVARAEDAARRFGQSPTVIAVVDARGALRMGLDLLRALAADAQERRAALMVLLSRDDLGALGEAFAAGATHYLVSPFGPPDIGHALRFADRYVRRLRASGAREAMVSAHAALPDSPRWGWLRGDAQVDVSDSLARLLGEPAVGATDIMTLFRRIPAADRLKFRRALRRHLLTGTGGDIEHRMPVDGVQHTLVHHVRVLRGVGGEVAGLAATVEDLDASRLGQRLAAHFDTLTGLANQIYSETWIGQLLGGRSAFDPACILVLLAISRFDQINASFGRPVADALLQAIARRIEKIETQTADDHRLVARLDGAQFAVAFAGPVAVPDVIQFCQKIGEAFERPFIVGGRVIHLSCRMGVAVGEPELGDADTLFRRATAALNDAKGQGPNSFQIELTGAGEDRWAKALGLEEDLRRALEEGGIEVAYQPQVELASGRIVGVEALVRWRHPLLGPLPAETVIDVAERAELTTRLSDHVRRLALTEASAWSGALELLRLSVNVTADDLKAGALGDAVARDLAQTGFPAGRLTLEITESGLIDDMERASALLASLRGRGVRIAIDDFGTGYSSLAYLRALPLDYLKVDKSLITDLSGSARDQVVVRGVVDMARSLGIDVVAEGVETEAQRDMLLRQGCDAYQGYLCAPPMRGEELAAFVAGWAKG
jgi:diguanylate cyclase (GGDEF)-like protein